MPTLEEWTGGAWKEVESGEDGVLRWYAEDYYAGDCKGLAEWAGCAESGRDVIALSEFHKSGNRYPAEYVWQTALHEASHALWYAAHTPGAGLMCHGSACGATYTVKEHGLNWPMKIRELDGQVYTLFSHPEIKHGMTPQQVAVLFGAPPPPTATPTPAPTPVPTPVGAVPTLTPSLSASELLAISAGTRCSGLASLKVLEWESYPRTDAQGRLTLSGSVGAGAPRLKDARRSVGGSRHPLFTFYALELGTNERGRFSSVGRLWPRDVESRLSGRGSTNVFAEVYEVTERSFDVAATLPVSILAHSDLYITVWSELVENNPNARGSTAAVGACKVWR